MKQKTLLAAAIAAALMLQTWTVSAQDASAQATTTDQAKQLDTVTVTGSRIRSVDMETAQPVFTLDRAEIQKQGFVSVGDICRT